MIYHTSFSAENPDRVSAVLSDLVGGLRVRAPSPPFPHGSWFVCLGDRQGSLPEILPACDASEDARLAAAAHHHRQAGLLWSGDAGACAKPGAPRPQRPEQPRREQPRAVAPTRAADAGLSLPRRAAAFRLGLFRSPEPLRSPNPPPFGACDTPSPPRGNRHMAAGRKPRRLTDPGHQRLDERFS
jgi:hypothetical protein